MIKNFKWKMASIAVVFAMASCTNRILDFTMVSSKNIDLSRGASFERGKSRVTGEDMAHWIILLPTSTVSIKEALDRAIESTPGCVALLDGVIYTKFWYIPYIYGQQVAIVEGTPLIDPSLTLMDKTYPTYGVIELTNKGDVKQITEMSELDYNQRKLRLTK
jgi:hypothetical protein